MVRDASGAKVPGAVQNPLRLEPKVEFKARYGRSPNEADACALAALAVKEVLGVLPFGWLPAATQPLVKQPDLPQTATLPVSTDFADGAAGDGVDAMEVESDGLDFDAPF